LELTVFSNKPHDFTVLCVQKLLSKWRFRVIAGQRETVAPKPDPGGALAIARTLNLSPSEFLYLGDTGTDMQTAVAAGMFPVGALWGFRPRKELLEYGARVLLEHPGDMLELLKSHEFVPRTGCSGDKSFQRREISEGITKIAIGSDHAGFQYKEKIKTHLTAQGMKSKILAQIPLNQRITLIYQTDRRICGKGGMPGGIVLGAAATAKLSWRIKSKHSLRSMLVRANRTIM
jgi:hypothetical protein